VKDIFSTLAKYSLTEVENYLTESFVFLLSHLLEKERDSALELLSELCVVDNEFAFDKDEAISVTTQAATEQGTPDIKISSPNKLLYIEVKHDSPLGERQIERYKQALDDSSARIKKVILLTRFAVAFGDEEATPDKHVRWFEIYNWIANHPIADPVSTYLANEFKSFLEEKQMTIQRVGWEYINGVPAFINLMNMVDLAIQNAHIDFYPTFPRATALEWRGFYLGKHKEFWCGIHFNNPLVFTFEIFEKTKFNKELLRESKYKLQEGKERLWFRLPLEEIHFFSLDKDEQLAELTKFLKTAYQDAQKMKIE
jgi:hypothetical protein